ncbi:myogenesis-regulating glycosidase isoform X1 [Phlebotomus argentipes]|uniref:myogenesis-regulating glycosidase isoform X1 n=1 Tax=Phlebotomus argentipes TaxID=94469 RepID=UPI0028937438|nr:myogenesis-regulating glycosidase isoform X1 [Phlebotomus argentipes]
MSKSEGGGAIGGLNTENIPWADDDAQAAGGSSATAMGSSADTVSSEESHRRRTLMGRRSHANHLYIKIPQDEQGAAKSSDKSGNVTSDDDENPGPLKEMESGEKRGLRRNSISLPTLNAADLEALVAVHDAAQEVREKQSRKAGDDGESMVCSIEPDTEQSSEDEEKKPSKKYIFRTKRRSSIAPLPALRLNDKEMIANEFDSQSVTTQNSITSASSLASLLKEKIQMFPSMLRKKKKSKDFKIKAFVACLFLIIVFLIGYAYIMYNQQILARSYFDRVKFNKGQRVIGIYNDKGTLMVTGRLGTTIHADKAYHCLTNNTLDDGSVCLEWDGKARMYLNFRELSPTVPCYTIRWQSLSPDVLPTDCYESFMGQGHWYGGGLTRGGNWPLETESFSFAPFITGDANRQQWGNALKRYFISSRGVAIQVDEKTPLYVSMNDNKSGEMCFRAKHDHFAFVNRLTALPELSYRICTSDNMRQLHQQMTQQSLWDGLKEHDINVVHSMLEEPVWQIPSSGGKSLTADGIHNYTERVIALGFLRLGHVLVNEFWQKHIGDFTLETERFPNLEETVTILHRRGFRIAFSVQPFISTDSANFAQSVAKKLLIYERQSERSIPALTRYKSVASAGVLDITNNASIPWLIEKLEKIQKDYKIDGFYLDFGTSQNMPHYYQCNKTLYNPDQYKTIFTTALEGVISLIGVSSAVTVPRPPAFVSLPPVNSSWDGLKTVVTSALTYGIIGYPFIMPGPIGGDYLLPPSATNETVSFYSMNEPPLPDQELYLRWMQLATFLPVIRFTHLPSEYKSDLVMEVVKELTLIRQKAVIPLLKKYLSDAMNEGLPLIRPLWMLDAQDTACLYVNDEFSIGENLIVAPILEKGQVQREVYLPQGVWKDGIDGSLRKGSRWIHNYRVPEDKVAYFMKMPDNTRF